MPFSSKICASSCAEYFFVPFRSVVAVRVPSPATFSKNSPPRAIILIAIISLFLFSLIKSVEPLSTVYLTVPLCSEIFVALCFTSAFTLLTFFRFSGKTIETALLFTPKYLLAAALTSSAVTFLTQST